MSMTTFIVKADNADGFDTRASATMAYTHAVLVDGPEGGNEGAISWHKSEAAARKAATGWQGHYTKIRVVPVESRPGTKAKVEKELAAEIDNISHHGSAVDFCNARKPGKGKASILCTLDAGHEGDHKEGTRSWPQAKAAAPAKAKAEPKAEKPAPSAAKAELIATNPGYVISTKSRSTKTVAVLIDARAGHPLALDESEGRWQTICLDHGKTAAHAGQRPARDSIGHPELWCPTCKRAAAKA